MSPRLALAYLALRALGWLAYGGSVATLVAALAVFAVKAVELHSVATGAASFAVLSLTTVATLGAVIFYAAVLPSWFKTHPGVRRLLSYVIGRSSPFLFLIGSSVVGDLPETDLVVSLVVGAGSLFYAGGLFMLLAGAIADFTPPATDLEEGLLDRSG